MLQTARACNGSKMKKINWSMFTQTQNQTTPIFGSLVSTSLT